MCSISDCLHSFTYGSSFSSFKTHANRKHPRWQEYVNDSRPVATVAEVSHFVETDNERQCLYLPEQSSSEVSDLPVPHPEVEVESCPTAQYTAALFLLTFQERYRLSQKSIDFAVGTVHHIVDSVCSQIQSSVEESLHSNTNTDFDFTQCFNYDDPFHCLKTEYQQTKFYKNEFGLVV